MICGVIWQKDVKMKEIRPEDRMSPSDKTRLLIALLDKFDTRSEKPAFNYLNLENSFNTLVEIIEKQKEPGRQG